MSKDKKTKENNLPCSLIEDKGLSEFKGVKTKTAITIGPEAAEKIDKITEHLKLL
ncbi:MAG: peptidyl-tRNA hydrolase [bacterium]